MILYYLSLVLLAPFRGIRWCWRHVTYEGLKKAAILFAMVFVVAMVVGVVAILDLLDESRARGIENQSLIRNTNALVERVDEQTSPEAQIRQQQQIDAILVKVDCNTREAFQDAIRQLVELGIPEAGSIRIITAECDDQDTTTTTAPGG